MSRCNSDPHVRPRILLVAFSCHPTASMESRVGWHRAVQVAKRYDTWVIYGDEFDRAELAAHARDVGVGNSLRFVRVENSRWGRRLCSSQSHLFWCGYANWQRRAFRMAQRIHRKRNFSLIHQVNFCGFREPGYCWKLGVPFVIGPVGGTQNYPWRYLSGADLQGGLREVTRSCINRWQMRFSPRIRTGFRTAAAVLAANSRNQTDLRRTLDVQPIRQLETGSDFVLENQRLERDSSEPLRILWAGRFRTWKGLPLLLRALARMPADCQFKLRVLGEGPCGTRWRRLATKLGLEQHVEWVGWPTYRHALRFYKWADVFAFTSLRDTSGAGLLEALAAGAPIVGLDHQGAQDIMTDDCAIRIPVSRPAATVDAFQQAFVQLVRRPALLRRLSCGAHVRAAHYHWDRQGERLDDVYRQVLRLEPVRNHVDRPPFARRDPSLVDPSPDEITVALAGAGTTFPQE